MKYEILEKKEILETMKYNIDQKSREGNESILFTKSVTEPPPQNSITSCQWHEKIHVCVDNRSHFKGFI